MDCGDFVGGVYDTYPEDSMRKEILDDDFLKKEIAYSDDLTSFDRWKSMLLDHAIFCFTVLPVFTILAKTVIPEEYTQIAFYFLFGIYINKDCLSGRSIAKRILGQVVIDLETGKPAKEIKCSIRNFTDTFWIFEVLVVGFNPNRRIGDLIAGTKIVRTEKRGLKNLLTDWQNVSKKKLLIAFGIALLYIWIILFIYEQFFRPLIWSY